MSRIDDRDKTRKIKPAFVDLPQPPGPISSEERDAQSESELQERRLQAKLDGDWGTDGGENIE